MTRLGRITDIERLPGSKRARRIWIDGAPFRTTSAAVVAALSIQVGDDVDLDDLATRCQQAERTAARERALKLLSYHDFSTAQVAQRLAEDGYERAAIDDVVARLVETGLLDDARFGEAVARSRLRAGYGPRVVWRDLARAGLPDASIASALSAAADEGIGTDATSAARRLVRPRDDARRLAARLVRRGFEPTDAYRAAREVVGDAGDDLDDGPADE
ncbi:RecX family transcriptional regulator [Coriobacteriia bacterium Es71-Z0120]|uniref:regulatory protein RecX n=1 Tax=Parvivirga hydrogeniphila TaxID=2939460 RepID=UPI002260A16F|nr:RecX family transcriptional regulator [Parvivirga hydrogeniphila]MCL4079621.1 RecX family transcriptional regulator [Parvivirga hydrogeniphila]